MKYDIFISYKRTSLPTANNLYYRLTTRGYSVFFDLEQLGRDNFNTQLLNNIDNAKDVFVILEEGSLDSCKGNNWEKDWFCREIAYALEKKKNIIPILIGGFNMPTEEFFPNELKELSLKNSPKFEFSFFEEYLNRLENQSFLLSKPNLHEKATSVFKFYSNESCQVFKEGKLVCSLEGMSNKPFYLPVLRKGDYKFQVENSISHEKRIIDVTIDAIEEKKVEIEWKNDNNEEKKDQAITSLTDDGTGGLRPLPFPTSSSKKWQKWLLWALLLAIPLVSLGCYAWIHTQKQSKNQKEEPLILFAGGGSAARFIKENYNSVDVKDYPSYKNSIFLNLPSETSWTLLAEEVNRRNENGGKQAFISICLSADSIDSLFIKSERAKILFLKARIISYYLGEDRLKVYVSRDLLSELNKNEQDKSIIIDDLVKLIKKINNKEIKARIFSTSKDSGTFRAYKRCDSTFNIAKIHQYISSFSKNYFQANDTLSFVILGSEHYKADSLNENEDYHPLFVMKNNTDYVTKPMFVYFVAHKRTDHYCSVSQPIIDFLRKLNIDKNDNQVNTVLWDSIQHKHSFKYGEEPKIIKLNYPQPQKRQ